MVDDEVFFTATNGTTQQFFSYDGEELDLFAQMDGDAVSYYSLMNSSDSLFFNKSTSLYYRNSNEGISSYQRNELLDLDLNIVHIFTSTPNSHLQIHDIKGNNVVSVVFGQEESTTSVFHLPTENSGVVEDRRFMDQPYSRISFINFYDKVLFEADKNNSESREKVSGYFDLDGIVRFIEQLRARIGIFDT